jgi:hypothetical protein
MYGAVRFGTDSWFSVSQIVLDRQFKLTCKVTNEHTYSAITSITVDNNNVSGQSERTTSDNLHWIKSYDLLRNDPDVKHLVLKIS